MTKIKTQYGDLTEKQWRLVVVEKLIAIEELLKAAELCGWSLETRQAIMRLECERRMYEIKKEKEKAKT